MCELLLVQLARLRLSRFTRTPNKRESVNSISRRRNMMILEIARLVVTSRNITNWIGEEDTSRRGSRTLWAHWQMQITAMTIGVPATRRPHGRWSNLRLALSNYPPLGITERWRKTPTPLPCRLTTVPRRRPNHLPSPDNPSPRPPRILGLGSENTNA